MVAASAAPPPSTSKPALATPRGAAAETATLKFSRVKLFRPTGELVSHSTTLAGVLLHEYPGPWKPSWAETTSRPGGIVAMTLKGAFVASAPMLLGLTR